MAAHRRNLPHVVVNMAMTADGKVATAGREVASFGSARDLDGLYALRATADGVICGARTVEETRATLGTGGEKFAAARVKGGLAVSPMRILVSGTASMSPDAEIWKHRFSEIVVLTTEAAPATRTKRLGKLADHLWVSAGDRIDFRQALLWLRRTFGVRLLVCEGGGELNAALSSADLIDELRITLVPRIFGGKESPTIAGGPSPSSLGGSRRFRLAESKIIDGEIFLRFLRYETKSKRRRV